MRKIAALLLLLLTVTMPAHSATAPPAKANVGDVFHLFYDICARCTSAHTYSVSRSSVVPSTPFATVTSFSEYGGKLMQIKGGPFEYSRHLMEGKDVDTNGSSGWIRDSSIDFTGHVSLLSVLSGCYPGGCFSIGEFRGDGVTLFDNTLPASTPTIP